MNRPQIQQFLRSIGMEAWADDVERLAGAEKMLEALREPTPEDVAHVLPRIENPSQPQREVGAAAINLLGHGQPIAYTIAAELVRDFQAMFDARFPDVRSREGQ